MFDTQTENRIEDTLYKKSQQTFDRTAKKYDTTQNTKSCVWDFQTSAHNHGTDNQTTHAASQHLSETDRDKTPDHNALNKTSHLFFHAGDGTF